MSRGARNAAAANERAMAEFRRQLLRLQAEFDVSAKRIVDQMADVGLRATKKATPVGVYNKEQAAYRAEKGAGRLFQKNKRKLEKPDYDKSKGRVGGTLRRGWIKHKTRKSRTGWTSGYTNNVEYGVYVNEGHRIVRDGATVGYIPGVHMLETGMRAAERALPSLLNAEIARIKGKTGF